jgi:hypothetical protein
MCDVLIKLHLQHMKCFALNQLFDHFILLVQERTNYSDAEKLNHRHKHSNFNVKLEKIIEFILH